MYHYAGNNPVKYVDPDGKSAIGTVSVFFAADVAVLEPTDIIPWKWLGWGVGFVVAATIDHFLQKAADADAKPADETSPLPEDGPESEKKASPKYPGNDPTKAPEGTEWRGRPGSKPGDKNGSYYNPNTGESFRPDLDHPIGKKVKGPHWDYNDGVGNRYRIYPDGNMEAK